MKANAGGQLGLNEILGRDLLISELWESLENQGVYISDDRRVGKTQILRKMKGEPKKGWLVVQRDLSSCHSAAEFATTVVKDSAQLLNGKTQKWKRITELYSYVANFEMEAYGFKVKFPNGKEAHWKELLSNTIADLEEDLNDLNLRMVFLWDELPYHIDNVTKRESPEAAMELLDVLRALSQQYLRVRFVYTGSIGLHHILAKLRSSGYSNEPVNHMKRVTPGPISDEDAQNLARELILGMGLKCNEVDSSAIAVSQVVGCVPFYIQKLVAYWPRKKILVPSAIEEVLNFEITKPQSDWELAHYRDRIPEYYKKNEDLVLAILNGVASSDKKLVFDQIFESVSSQITFGEKEKKTLRVQIALLEQDHYLQQDSVTLGYDFRFKLVKRWWRIKQCS